MVFKASVSDCLLVSTPSKRSPCCSIRVRTTSIVYTDESAKYWALRRAGMDYDHRRIYHSLKVYVQGDIHTSTVDGFWALVKNGIGGVYHDVLTKHLQAYLDEYAFRYNNRENPAGMFSV